MENSAELHKLIEASTLFHDVQPEETAAILARLQPSHYEQGVHILERGVWHGRLHIVASGHVSVLLPAGLPGTPHTVTTPAHESYSTEEYVIARLGPGECFGEMSLITGEPPTATIRAEQDVTLWSLSQTDFLALVGACPTLLKNINTILTRRLSRTNQHIFSHITAELLALVETPDAPREHALAFHIAESMAVCSQKRVLLLELCGLDEATSPHFAAHSDQIRPTLLECSQDSSRLSLHQAATSTQDGQHFPALAALATTPEQALAVDAGMLVSLTDLALYYDFILLATTRATPTHIVEAVAGQCQRAIVLISAEFTAIPLAVRDALHSSLFVSHVSERPTIGLQDYYTAQLGHPLTRLLPADKPLLEQCWQQRATPRQLAPQAELSKAIQFVARHISHQTIGIAFGGGGARGFAHLGVLERLLHYGVPLDYIAACSSGIITPGMYLIGKSLEESEEIFLDIQRHIVQWNFPRVSIFSNRGLKHMLRTLCGDMRFEDLTTPFAMVAIDLATRAGVVLDRGPLWQAALASVALPGIFPPVLIGQHILMDAGMHDPVPIRLARKMGADILLASELGGQQPPSLESATPWLREAEKHLAQKKQARSPHIVDVVLKTYDLAMATIGMHSIREADVVIRPKLHRVSLRQFSEGRKFVAAGREAVETAMPELRKRLPWL